MARAVVQIVSIGGGDPPPSIGLNLDVTFISASGSIFRVSNTPASAPQDDSPRAVEDAIVAAVLALSVPAEFYVIARDVILPSLQRG